MSGINSLQHPPSTVAGYKPGDRIGAGVVLDPAATTDRNGVKWVTVDANKNGNTDFGEDLLLVKLPPKGYGLDHYDRTKAPCKRAIDWALFIGAPSGVIFGIQAGALADAGYLGAKLATSAGTNRVMLATGIAVVAAAGIFGYITKKNELAGMSEHMRRESVPNLVQPKTPQPVPATGCVVVGCLPGQQG